MTDVVRGRHHVSRPTAFWLLAVSLTITMLGTTLPTPLYPLYQARYGFGGLMVTIIYAVYALGVIAALLLFGTLSDQIGRRRLLLPGLLLSGLSATVFLLADATIDLFLGRLLSGLSAGIITGTTTAAMIDLVPERERDRASLVATATTMAGLGIGPVLAGVLAQYAPLPLRLSFAAHLVLVVVALVCIGVIPEPHPTPGRARLHVQRLRVPATTRGIFVRAAIGGFAAFAVFGLFAAATPALLAEVLHERNHALTGLMVFAAFAASTVSQVATARMMPRRALLIGCLGLAAGIAIVATSLVTASLAILVVGALTCGLAQGLVFRPGLTLVDDASPADQRSDVASSYFVTLYIANTLPVIAVGAAAGTVGLVAAGVIFSGLVAVLALLAFVALLGHNSKHTVPNERRRGPGSSQP